MAKHKIALDKQYIRNKQPVSTEDQDGIVGVAFAGYSFEGEKIDTEWYKDSNGNFYWAGGVVSFDSLIATQIDYGKIDYEKHWWYQKLEIQKLHETLGTKGKGANILVLDMGIPDGSPLLKNIRLDTQNSYNFSNQIEDKNLHTPSNHGIVMANFIGSKNTDCPGIAPDANIIMGKIAMDGHSIGMRRLIRALTFYSESNIPIDVVSISGGASNYANPNDPEIGEIKNLIKKFIESKNAIVVAALGNGENNDDEDFPARFEQVIGVGY
jgi:subtilisin family serine protease